MDPESSESRTEDDVGNEPEDRPTGTGRVAAGPLRPAPAAPAGDWRPSDGPREVPAEEARRAERPVPVDREGRGRPQRDHLRRVMGLPALQALGWILFVLGGLIYLHGLWATANATVDGAGAAEQTIAIGGVSFLQGTIGLVLAVVGLVLGVLFIFVPVRYEPPLVPGTLEFEVAAENLLRSRNVRRILIWSGAGLFFVGLLIAWYPLKQTVLDGELWAVRIGGLDYRIHFWGYVLAALGAALCVPLAIGQGSLERAAAVAHGALPGNRVRRVADRPPRGPADEPERSEEPPHAPTARAEPATPGSLRPGVPRHASEQDEPGGP